MPAPVPRISIALLIGWVAAGGSLHAQADKKAPVPESAPSIQQQINELKQTQQRILDELAEIKQLLQEKNPRAEFSARPAAPNLVSLNVHGEKFRGDAGAKVAIVEYSDFECSYCATFAREVYQRIDTDYIKPGKVKFFFRDLPAPEHPGALQKAVAARCAGEQGKFWEMHELLFAYQNDPPAKDMSGYAQILGLDLAKFNECLASPKYVDVIRRSAAGAGRVGVAGTPAFLVGTITPDGDFFRSTKLLVGAEDYETFKTALDELLTSAPKP
jgi:protein-disulfide isomerase